MTEAISSFKLEHDHSHRCYLFDLLVQKGLVAFKVKADNHGLSVTTEAGLLIVSLERLACSLTNLQTALLLLGIEPKTFFVSDTTPKH